jgi:hypothetical protein
MWYGKENIYKRRTCHYQGKWEERVGVMQIQVMEFVIDVNPLEK